MKLLKQEIFASILVMLLGSLLTLGATNELNQSSRHQSQSQNTRRVEPLTDALAALEKGDTVTAKRLLQSALSKTPNDPTAHTYLGVIADREGDFPSAERHFALAVRYAPDAAAYNNYGAILLRQNRIAEATAQFTRALRLDPDNYNSLINLAQIHFKRNAPKDLLASRDMFARAHKIKPHQDIARALIITSLRLKDTTAAASYYRDYTQLIIQNTLRADSNPDARAELGQALLEGDLITEAIEELRAALVADNSNISALISLAHAYLRRKDIPAAGRVLEVAVARGQDDAQIYSTLAEVYQHAGKPENAIPAMRLAIARAPNSEAYHFRYGILLTESSAPAAAVIRLQEALTEFPRSSRLWLALGIAQIANGKNGDAAKAFEHALSLDPKFAPAFAYLGTTYDERGEYTEALKFYDEAIKADERSAPPYYLAAEAILKSSTPDLNRVENYLQRAVAIDEGFAQARVSLGKVLLRTDRPAEAVKQLQRAIELEPNFAQAYYQLGRALQRLKQPTEAQVALNKFKQLNDEQKKGSEDRRRDLVRRMTNVLF